jgi:tRNA threonylcarbamoyladenosine biosynthesis protein TsaB
MGMHTLSINTSTKQYSLAVMKGESLLGEYTLPSGPQHFAHLMPSLNNLLMQTGIGPEQLNALIVALGPGSFTGVRIGLAVAKGFSQSLGIPIIGIPTLLAMASQLPYTKENICPLVTSRKGEIFTALFRWSNNGRLCRIKKDTSLRIADMGSMIKDKAVLIGNDFPNQGPLLKKLLGRKGFLAPSNLWGLRASSLGILGLKKLKKNVLKNPEELVPVYLREPDIRLPDVASRQNKI